MPSGKTHDRVTWISAPVVALLAWLLSQQLVVSAVATLAYVFAGLMFSGDLDVKSVQYKRWGWLRWIWIPYQKSVSHRSP
ncbi:MAG: metal-binding protein, partial [Candidatus Sericytochromatia bacterium]